MDIFERKNVLSVFGKSARGSFYASPTRTGQSEGCSSLAILGEMLKDCRGGVLFGLIEPVDTVPGSRKPPELGEFQPWGRGVHGAVRILRLQLIPELGDGPQFLLVWA